MSFGKIKQRLAELVFFCSCFSVVVVVVFFFSLCLCLYLFNSKSYDTQGQNIENVSELASYWVVSNFRARADVSNQKWISPLSNARTNARKHGYKLVNWFLTILWRSVSLFLYFFFIFFFIFIFFFFGRLSVFAPVGLARENVWFGVQLAWSFSSRSKWT